MSLALDSNVLLYFHGFERRESDRHKIDCAQDMIPRLLGIEQVVLPVQVLGETYHVLAGKGGFAPAEARAVIDHWRPQAIWRRTSLELFEAGLDRASKHRLQIWDALIIAVAVEAGCDLLLSEDMQSGFVWRGLTIVNPFASSPHPRLEGLLAKQR